ncbi:MAG: acetyl-CoA carboxylase biotin carboxyl carrier protein [Verrucomicrobiaceae bacterium]|jgi:acetyl-CoA carboxylase biotin carboxyl carrier protein|nr:acetyl-CoA carboxylase biotin carboxyl carrier protein [Verrucomicrobiaceae bacterium]
MDQPKSAAKEANTLDLKQIRQIVALMAENDLSYFHFEQEGSKIELRRGSDFETAKNLLKYLPTASGHASAPAYALPATPISAAPPVNAPSVEVAPEVAGPAITSPMVGTFYLASAPGEAPFVKIGDQVDENTTVCIIEAMKVMNEIKAETRGVVARLLAVDGKPVQYGQPLFELKA